MTDNVGARVADILDRCKKAGLDLTKSCYPTAEQWKDILDYPANKKLTIVNTFIFSADPLAGIGGPEASDRYLKRLEKLGVKTLAGGVIKGTLAGKKEPIDWQVCSVMEFPNKEAVVDYFIGDLDMQKKRANFTAELRILILEPFE